MDVVQLMGIFLGELEDGVAAFNRDLLALEQTSNPSERAEFVHALFRTAHSLKGAARNVSIRPIEEACEPVEDILGQVRERRRDLDPELYSLLYTWADGLEEAGKRLREEASLDASPLTRLIPRLEDAAEHGRQLVAPPRHEPTPEPPPPPVAPAPPPSHEAPTRVRVDASKLDALMANSGELLVARHRLEGRVAQAEAARDAAAQGRSEWRQIARLLGSAAALPPRAEAAFQRLGEQLRQLERDLDRLATNVADDGRVLREAATRLDDEVRHARMRPFGEACGGLDRLVRDLASEAGKQVQLVIEGGDQEIDRAVLDALQDPLRHLVRNAVDHGAETPAERSAAGKAPACRLVVAARLRGEQVEVTVSDDGRGLDPEALRQRARRLGLPEPSDDREAWRMIFLPGVSTRTEVTAVSGRGVGLDVVKRRAESMGGRVDVDSVRGRGTRFRLTCPLTLSTLRVLLVHGAGETYALPGSAVQWVVRLEPTTFRRVEGRPIAAINGRPVPVVPLTRTLGRDDEAPTEVAGKLSAVVLTAEERLVAFSVDGFLGEQEVLVHPLSRRIRRTRFATAATILPAGRVALVLNPAALVRAALRHGVAAAPAAPTEAPSRPRILVADDSLTTRTLEKSILEAAGYDVTTANDGEAAWQRLQERGADLLVSDVDMPRLDGFELTRRVRASERFATLPVILVTSRQTDEDRVRGAEAGADAYLPKSTFDQRALLDLIAEML